MTIQNLCNSNDTAFLKKKNPSTTRAGNKNNIKNAIKKKSHLLLIYYLPARSTKCTLLDLLIS